MKELLPPLVFASVIVGVLIWIIGMTGYNTPPHPQTPAQVYEECVKQIPSEVITLDMYQAQISACLQISQLASSTNL